MFDKLRELKGELEPELNKLNAYYKNLEAKLKELSVGVYASVGVKADTTGAYYAWYGYEKVNGRWCLVWKEKDSEHTRVTKPLLETSISNRIHCLVYTEILIVELEKQTKKLIEKLQKTEVINNDQETTLDTDSRRPSENERHSEDGKEQSKVSEEA